jgi:uncharacterized protein (TIGR03089 family)
VTGDDEPAGPAPATTGARSARDVLDSLAVTAGARPCLTWYGTGGERVELSGRVLGNWVTKATNMLVEEADAGPGVRVHVALPAHWRALVWAAAAWNAGAEVVLGDAGAADVVVTDRPAELAERATAGALVIAVALPALALSFPSARPAGALDGAADLMSYGDTLGPLAPLDPQRPALDGGVSHAQLLPWARRAAGSDAWPPAPRVLVRTDGVARVLGAAWAAWASGGSVVLVGDAMLDVAAVAAAERVSVTVDPPGGASR